MLSLVLCRADRHIAPVGVFPDGLHAYTDCPGAIADLVRSVLWLWWLSRSVAQYSFWLKGFPGECSYRSACGLCGFRRDRRDIAYRTVSGAWQPIYDEWPRAARGNQRYSVDRGCS